MAQRPKQCWKMWTLSRSFTAFPSPALEFPEPITVHLFATKFVVSASLRPQTSVLHGDMPITQGTVDALNVQILARRESTSQIVSGQLWEAAFAPNVSAGMWGRPPKTNRIGRGRLCCVRRHPMMKIAGRSVSLSTLELGGKLLGCIS